MTRTADRVVEMRQWQYDELTEEIAKLRAALTEIRDHWANQYDHPRKQTPMYDGMYGIGVTDGHRAAADIARRALDE
jgi:hypothetical protein